MGIANLNILPDPEGGSAVYAEAKGGIGIGYISGIEAASERDMREAEILIMGLRR